MSKQDQLDYLTGADTQYSMFNQEFKDNLTTTDYDTFTITDKYKYRADLIAQDILGSSSYTFLLLWINDFDTFDDMDSGRTIIIPTTNYVQKYYDMIKKEKLG